MERFYYETKYKKEDEYNNKEVKTFKIYSQTKFNLFLYYLQIKSMPYIFWCLFNISKNIYFRYGSNTLLFISEFLILNIILLFNSCVFLKGDYFKISSNSININYFIAISGILMTVIYDMSLILFNIKDRSKEISTDIINVTKSFFLIFSFVTTVINININTNENTKENSLYSLFLNIIIFNIFVFIIKRILFRNRFKKNVGENYDYVNLPGKSINNNNNSNKNHNFTFFAFYNTLFMIIFHLIT